MSSTFILDENFFQGGTIPPAVKGLGAGASNNDLCCEVLSGGDFLVGEEEVAELLSRTGPRYFPELGSSDDDSCSLLLCLSRALPFLDSGRECKPDI